MAISTYRPWGLLGELQREMNQLWGDRNDDSVVNAEWIPAVDVIEKIENFEIRADLPGVDPKSIDITMENGILTLHGNREQARENGTWHRTERATGAFYRRFALPESADAERISAKSDNGVLVISIPKLARTQPRKIQVKPS